MQTPFGQCGQAGSVERAAGVPQSADVCDGQASSDGIIPHAAGNSRPSAGARSSPRADADRRVYSPASIPPSIVPTTQLRIMQRALIIAPKYGQKHWTRLSSTD